LTLDEIVRRLARRVRRHPRTLLKWFDDAGAVEVGGTYLLVKVDGFAASRALYPWCSYGDLGFRAVTGAVSDVLAKGCRPYIYAVSLGVTPDRVDNVEELTKGVEEAVELYGGYLENLDTNVGYDTWVDVFVVAECRHRPIPRGARPGDVVVLARSVGLSSIAYLEFSAGRAPDLPEVRAFSCRPRAEPAVADAVEELSGCLSGSIDISDTLLESLQQLVEPYGVYLELDPSYVLHPLAVHYSRSSGVPKHILLLASNEEYVPVLACRSSCAEEVVNVLRSKWLNAAVLGTVLEIDGVTWRGTEVKGISWDYASGRVVVKP